MARKEGNGSLKWTDNKFCENNYNHSIFKSRGSTLMNQFPDLKANDFPAELKKNEGERKMIGFARGERK